MSQYSLDAPELLKHCIDPNKAILSNRTTTLFRTSEETRYSDDPTATITETVQGTVTSTTTTYIYNEPIKRHVATINPVLRDIEKRHPKSFVSQACSCVYKPTTKTVTRTAKVTKYTTQTSTKAAPPPAKVTDTRDVSITEHVTITVSELLGTVSRALTNPSSAGHPRPNQHSNVQSHLYRRPRPLCRYPASGMHSIWAC